MTAPPRKPVEIKVTANGFTWAEAIAALRARLELLEEHHAQGAGVSASGHGGSHTADVTLRDVTRDQFIDESIAWLEGRHS